MLTTDFQSNEGETTLGPWDLLLFLSLALCLLGFVWMILKTAIYFFTINVTVIIRLMKFL